MCLICYVNPLFLWNNGLREAVVTDDVFVFEHFFYSVLITSYTLLKILSIDLWLD